MSDREGSGSQTMTTTTSSELEFRRDLAALDADIHSFSEKSGYCAKKE